MLEPGVKNSNGVGRIRLFKGVELRRGEGDGGGEKERDRDPPEHKANSSVTDSALLNPESAYRFKHHAKVKQK